MLLRRPPSAPLDTFVESVWFAARGALAHTRERGLPTGCVDVVVPLLQDAVLRYEDERDAAPRRVRGPVVQGAHDRPTLRGTGGPSVVAGVHFKPGGAAALFGGAVPELSNRTLPLDELWGPCARTLQHALHDAAADPHAALRVLERLLQQRLHDAAPADPMVDWALAAFARDPARARVEPVQRASGLAPATFIRRFEREVGLTPKRYARVLRLNALLPSLVRAGPRDWARLAPEAGYCDQSHLIREFRRLAGITPLAYTPVQPDRPTHVALPG